MRIRTVKPDFWASESNGRLSRDARLVFIGMFNLADDAGRFRASSTFLASSLLPYDDDGKATIEHAKAELSKQNKVIFYTHDGDTYGEICNFKKHQKIDKRWPSTLPSPDDSLQLSPILSDSLPRNGMECSGREVEGKEVSSPPKLPAANAGLVELKITKPIQEQSSKHGFNIGQMFVDAYRKFQRGKNYRIDGPDTAAIRSLYKHTFKPGDAVLAKRCIEKYLYDPAKFLVDMRWKLEYLPKHVNKYIADCEREATTEESHDTESTEPDPYYEQLEKLDSAGPGKATGACPAT